MGRRRAKAHPSQILICHRCLKTKLKANIFFFFFKYVLVHVNSGIFGFFENQEAVWQRGACIPAWHR